MALQYAQTNAATGFYFGTSYAQIMSMFVEVTQVTLNVTVWADATNAIQGNTPLTTLVIKQPLNSIFQPPDIQNLQVAVRSAYNQLPPFLNASSQVFSVADVIPGCAANSSSPK